MHIAPSFACRHEIPRAVGRCFLRALVQGAEGVALLPIGRAMEAMKRKKGLSENMLVDGEEVDAMPAIELVEHERTAYVKGMEDYLRELKLMPNNEAVRKSREGNASHFTTGFSPKSSSISSVCLR